MTTRRVYHAHSRVDVVVYSHTTGGIFQSSPATLNMSAHLRRFECTKTLHAPTGNATLSLKVPQANVALQRDIEAISDDDWVIVTRHCHLGLKRPSLYLVDTVIRHEQTSSENGVVMREYSLVCSDIGKPFTTHEFKFIVGIPVPVPGVITLSPQATLAGFAGAGTEPSVRMQRLFRLVFRPDRVRKRVGDADLPSTGKEKPKPKKKKTPLAEGQLTANFHVREFVKWKPETDIPPDVLANLKLLAEALQKLRDDYFDGKAVNITKRGGYSYSDKRKSTSQHRLGKAADITVAGMAPEAVVNAIRQAIEAEDVPWGGLGLYKGFVHYDIREKPVDHLWYGKNGEQGQDEPTDAQKAATAPQHWAPSWATGAEAVDTEIEDEGSAVPEREPEPTPAEDDVEMMPAVSGDGAYVAPIGIASALHPGAGSKVPRFDWVDVIDDRTHNDPSLNVAGNWWQMLSVFSMQSATFDELVRAQADSAFNEVFYDVRPPEPGSDPNAQRSAIGPLLGGWTPCIIFRRRPFDPYDWEQLPLYQLPEGAVQHSTATKSGGDRKTLYQVLPPGTSDALGASLDDLYGTGEGHMPALSLDSIRRHGLRALTLEHQFAGLFDSQKSYVEAVRTAHRSAYGWHEPTGNVYADSVQVPMLLAYALVGIRAEYRDARGDLRRGYVEQVRETFEVDGTTRAVRVMTHIELTRIHDPRAYPYPAIPSWRY